MKNVMSKQKGFTLNELIFVAFFVFGIGIFGTAGFVAWHFISK